MAWQEQNGTQLPVTVQYVRNADGSVGFALGSYDPTALLTIDPVVSISSFGDESSITSTDIVIDSDAGFAYISGYVYDGSRDAVIMARTLGIPAAEEILYLHGAGNDEGHGIAVDSSGAVYLVGETNSSGFLDSTEYHGGNCSPYIQYDCPDIFVARLTYGPNGFTITGRTLLGSTQDERGNGIAVDAAGDIYVTGSIDLTHAYGARLHWDAVNQVLNPVYTVALDGDGQASGYGIAVDADHNAYIAGITALYIGGEFPGDAYIAKLTAAGAVVWEQSLGGEYADYANRVALDEQGRVYLTDATSSFANFPTLNPLPVSYGGTSGEGGDYIAFAAMYTSAGVPVYRTLVAGDGGNGIAVDQDGRAYIATNRFIQIDDDSYELQGVALAIEPNGTAWGYDQPLGMSGAAGIALGAYATAYVVGDNAVAKVGQGLPLITVEITSAPTQIAITNGQYTPNPFTVVATVSNQSTEAAADVRLTLTLPTGLTLVGDSPLKGIGEIPPGASRQVLWLVNAVEQGQETTLTYTVTTSVSGVPSQTVSRQITIPPFPFTTSYYMKTTDTTTTRSLGCLAQHDKVEGIVILGFGHPRNLGTDAAPVYGAQFIRSERKVQLSEIATAVKAFAQGYIEGCDPETYPRPAPANLIIAIGTDNSKVQVDVENDIWQDNPGLTREHGQAWAQMVTQVNDWLKGQGYYGGVQAAGGFDAEFGAKVWASSGTFDWAEGYDSEATTFYYNSGACESCPRAQPRAEWTNSPNSADPNGLHSFAHVQSADRVFRISWKISYALPLPQIYLKAYAQEWYNIRRYAREQGRIMIIQGVMTECQSSSCDVNDTEPWTDFSATSDLPPRQGWQALYDTLNAPLAPDGSPNTYPQTTLRWVTDIDFQPEP